MADQELFYLRSFSEKGYWSNQNGWVSDFNSADTFTKEVANEFAGASAHVEILPSSGSYFDFYLDTPITEGDEIRYPAEDGEVFIVRSIMNPDGVEREYLVFQGNPDFNPVVTIRDKNWDEMQVMLLDTDMSYILDEDFLLAKAECDVLNMSINSDDNAPTDRLEM